MSNIPEKTRVKRVPKRGIYEIEEIHAILDKSFVCQVGFIHHNLPIVIPTLYGRHQNNLYLHGSMASRMMKSLKEGIDISICVTLVNGLVLARSAFHHSANYESVVLFGKAFPVEDPTEKMEALLHISEHIIKGRWEEVRQPSPKEMKATMVLKIPIEEASAKVRTGGPKDDKADYELDIWAGVIPFTQKIEAPIPDELLKDGLEVPDSVVNYLKATKS